MLTAAVGFHCPECAAPSKTAGFNRPRKIRSYRVPSASAYAAPQTGSLVPLTAIILLANIVVFVISAYDWGTIFPGSGNISWVERNYGIFPLDIEFRNEWWRLLTGGFAHSGLFHIGFNMLFLWILGKPLETVYKTYKFGILYLVALLGGSFGSLLTSGRFDLTVGASGGVFGLMGAYVILTRFTHQRMAGSPIMFLLVANLVVSFVLPGVSWGGHLGGLLAGSFVSLCYTYLASYTPKSLRHLVIYAAPIIVGGLCFVGGIQAAGWALS